MKRQYEEPTFRRVKGEGLFKKYNVTRVDGEPVDVPCFVMALRPTVQVWSALEAYALEVREANPALARDLETKAGELEAEWADGGDPFVADRPVGHPSEHIRGQWSKGA